MTSGRGLLGALFGGHNRPPETNPLPGVGGYDMPRGPYGEGGFPGSTPAAPPVHPQTSEGIPQRKLTVSGAQQEWNTVPTRRKNGTPRQPKARNLRQALDTEKWSSPVLAQNVPGDENQRNTVYYGGRQAEAGMPETGLSANLSGGRKPVDVTTVNRYVFNGMNGGFESEAFDRSIPYRIHARGGAYDGAPSNRGADLSGNRFTMQPSQNLNSGGHGHYGIGRQRGPNHRPVKFEMPGPWSANYYDVAPQQGTNQPDMIHNSPGGGYVPTPVKTPVPAGQRKLGRSVRRG